MHLDPQDEERLSAYLDGELSSDEQARVEQLLAEEPAARQLLDELRAVSSTLQSLPRTRVPGNLAADVLREIERRGVQPAAGQGSRTLQSAVADAVGSAGAEPARDGTDTAKPSAEPSVKPYVEEPVDWRQRLIRPLVYASIAVAVFAAVSLMTERAGDVPDPIARHLAEEYAADAERADKAERSDATFDTDRDTTTSESLGKEDGQRRRNMARPDARFAAPAAAPGASVAGDSAAGEDGAGGAGMTLSKPGPLSSQPGQSQMAGQAADPRLFYFQQAVVNQEPVLVVQCRVTAEAVRQDLVGKLLAKNSVAVDDEAAAELDTAINTNVGYGQGVTPTPDSVVVQQSVVVEQSAMPFDEATPADAATEPEMPTDLARQQAPAQQSIAQDAAAPSAEPATDADRDVGELGDRDNKVAAKHRGEPAFRNGERFESGEAASGGSTQGANEPTVYLIDASPEQLEGVLADLKSQTEGVVSVMVSPAPEAPTQNDYLNYNRGAPPEAVIVADETAPLTETPAESATDLFTEPAAPAAAQPAAHPPTAPAASQIADQAPAVDQSLQLGQSGWRVQRRVTNADEVRLQVQALGVLEEQLQNSPAPHEKLDRHGNSSRARKLRPDTLSNFMPAPDGNALYGQMPALANQANQAAAVNAPPEANDAPASGAATPDNTATLGAAGAQAAAPQNDGAESRRMAAVRRSGQRAGQALQRAVIVLEVQPVPPAPAKKG